MPSEAASTPGRAGRAGGSRNVSSTPCNGGRIVSLRNRLGWTQETLAAAADCSDRLIRKAESSGTLKAATLETLAKVFRREGLAVEAAELRFDPEAFARDYFTAMYTERGGVIDALEDRIADDVVFRIAGEEHAFPFAGEHVGKDAARRAFAAFFSVLEPPEDHSEIDGFEYMPTETGVMVFGETYAHPIGVPMDEPMPISIRMDFRDGKLILFDDRFDTARGIEHLRRAARAIDVPGEGPDA